MAQLHTDQCFGIAVCKAGPDGVLDCALCTCGHAKSDHAWLPKQREPEECFGADGACRCQMFERRVD